MRRRKEDDPKSGETAEKQREAMYTGAAEDLSNLISMDKLNAEGLLLRGCLEANSKKYAKRGMEDLATVIELSPTDPRPHLARALSYENQGVAVEAIAEYIEARKSKKEGAFACYAALVYAQFLVTMLRHLLLHACLHRDVSCACVRRPRECFFRSGDYARALRYGQSVAARSEQSYSSGDACKVPPRVRWVKLASADCWSLAQLYLSRAQMQMPLAPQPVTQPVVSGPHHPGRRQTRCGSCDGQGCLSRPSRLLLVFEPAGGPCWWW